MKKLILTTLLALAMAVPVLGQSTNSPPLTEMTILVNQSTNLNAVKIRVTFQNVTFDPTTFLPLLTLRLEAYNADAEQVANRTWIPTLAQIKAWYASATPWPTAKAAICARYGLTERTP